ncbi:granzyme H isoform X1 [Mustela putorius furo]|uniref:Granzyme H isoform X1 n=2 Tax=Mustela putorius furo TaxID=9669 RepID=A0A8U0RIA1_MUSPF|nr:granzyme H isoform X1 [Mustela putorius furo]
MQPLLLLLALLLPLGTGTEEIIGGHEVKPHSRPYMAFLQFLDNGKKRRCGSVLVHKYFVLTAAHCRGSSMRVILGAHNIEKKERTQQVIPVKRAIPHPDYKNFSNDIMLLKGREKTVQPHQGIQTPRPFSKLDCLASSHQLERKAKQTAAVKPLRLPESKNPVRPGQVCSVAGWGRVSMTTLATTLQEVSLEVQKDATCASLFPRYYSGATQICVGDPEEMKTAFKGDSGDPLVCNNMVQGIFSYGKQNGTPPGIFMKVSHFLPWIKRTMKRL